MSSTSEFVTKFMFYLCLLEPTESITNIKWIKLNFIALNYSINIKTYSYVRKIFVLLWYYNYKSILKDCIPLLEHDYLTTKEPWFSQESNYAYWTANTQYVAWAFGFLCLPPGPKGLQKSLIFVSNGYWGAFLHSCSVKNTTLWPTVSRLLE